VEKMTMYLGVFVGGTIGGYLPVTLLHVGWFSWESIVFGFVGSAVGLWLGWRLTQWIDS
jgi:uncharacterized membrane protein YeaQ/YmgE (transglycosylase-associated protein family)